jgi:hypothetical protein
MIFIGFPPLFTIHRIAALVQTQAPCVSFTLKKEAVWCWKGKFNRELPGVSGLAGFFLKLELGCVDFQQGIVQTGWRG